MHKDGQFLVGDELVNINGASLRGLKMDQVGKDNIFFFKSRIRETRNLSTDADSITIAMKRKKLNGGI